VIKKGTEDAQMDMKKCVLRFTFITGLFAISAVNAAGFSNMIMFGDSLSDGGNLPESTTPYIDPSQPKTAGNTDPEFYVPITNPVDTSHGYANPLTISMRVKKNYNWPSLDTFYLSNQASIIGNNTPRAYHSISWPQFFMNYAAQDGLTSSQNIAPSYLLQTHNYATTLSVNYAWGYALSTAGCTGENYQALPSCDVASIDAARAAYVSNPSAANRANLEIPGAQEQVTLFLQDVKAHKVAVTHNTLYTFWIGSNDLIIANHQMDKGHLGPVVSFMLGSTGKNTITAIKTLLAALPKSDRPAKVYVFNLINPGLTPGYHNSKLATLGNFLIASSNYWLNFNAFTFNLLSPTKIQIIPVYSWYQTASTNAYYSANIGKACQVSGGDYTHAGVIPSTNCHGFMFWNDVHPAAPLHMDTAYHFEQSIEGGAPLVHQKTVTGTQVEAKRIASIKMALAAFKQ
jgi:phospholipase/lecithinase/hemolysin